VRKKERGKREKEEKKGKKRKGGKFSVRKIKDNLLSWLKIIL
jgi:hypothetical protein